MSSYFLIATLSVILVMMYATSKTIVYVSWAGTSQILDYKLKDVYLINVQDILEDGLDLSSSVFSQDSDNPNELKDIVFAEGLVELQILK